MSAFENSDETLLNSLEIFEDSRIIKKNERTLYLEPKVNTNVYLLPYNMDMFHRIKNSFNLENINIDGCAVILVDSHMDFDNINLQNDTLTIKSIAKEPVLHNIKLNCNNIVIENFMLRDGVNPVLIHDMEFKCNKFEILGDWNKFNNCKGRCKMLRLYGDDRKLRNLRKSLHGKRGNIKTIEMSEARLHNLLEFLDLNFISGIEIVDIVDFAKIKIVK